MTPLLIDALARITDPLALRCLLLVSQRVADADVEGPSMLVGPASHFLDSDDAEIAELALQAVAKVAKEPDAATMAKLVALLEVQPGWAAQIAAALGRVGVPGSSAPVAGLARVMRGEDRAAAEAAAAALGQIGGHRAVAELVKLANGDAGWIVVKAAQALGAIDPDADVIGERDASSGRWVATIQLHCLDCRGLLRWRAAGRREELRCEECDLEHLLSGQQRIFRVQQAPFGHCLCADCRRKQLLIRQDQSQTLCCPLSDEVHIRPFDHPRQVRLLSSLPYGACACCAEPQPLIRIDERVHCYRTRRAYADTAQGYLPVESTEVVHDVAAINAALLEGTLGIGESGLPTVTDDD